MLYLLGNDKITDERKKYLRNLVKQHKPDFILFVDAFEDKMDKADRQEEEANKHEHSYCSNNSTEVSALFICFYDLYHSFVYF
jgi:hypothetical protein